MVEDRQDLGREAGLITLATSTFWLAVFLLLVVAGIGGMFLYGWVRRKDKPPKVAPLPPDEDDWK